MRSCRAIAVPLLALLGGCGDSLLGPNGLAGLEAREGPVTPAWELRAYQGPDLGFVSPCELQPVSSADVIEEGLAFDYVDVVEPTLGEPAVWIDGGDYRYAAAVLLLHDLEGSARMQRRSTLDEPMVGVWGGVGWTLALWASGDLEALGDALQIMDGHRLVDGPQFIDFPFAHDGFDGDFTGDLLNPEDSVGFEFYLPVDTVETLPAAISDIAQGRNPGGVAFETCE